MAPNAGLRAPVADCFFCDVRMDLRKDCWRGIERADGLECCSAAYRSARLRAAQGSPAWQASTAMQASEPVHAPTTDAWAARAFPGATPVRWYGAAGRRPLPEVGK